MCDLFLTVCLCWSKTYRIVTATWFWSWGEYPRRWLPFQRVHTRCEKGILDGERTTDGRKTTTAEKFRPTTPIWFSDGTNHYYLFSYQLLLLYTLPLFSHPVQLICFHIPGDSVNVLAYRRYFSSRHSMGRTQERTIYLVGLVRLEFLNLLHFLVVYVKVLFSSPAVRHLGGYCYVFRSTWARVMCVYHEELMPSQNTRPFSVTDLNHWRRITLVVHGLIFGSFFICRAGMTESPRYLFSKYVVVVTVLFLSPLAVHYLCTRL